MYSVDIVIARMRVPASGQRVKAMEKNRKITFENGVFTVYGKEIPMEGDMYCLNDLFGAMDEQGIYRQQFSLYARNKSFVRLIKNIIGIDVRNGKLIINKLCHEGALRRIGRRGNARLYASLPLMWCILVGYNEELTKDASEVLLSAGFRK